MLTNIFYAGRLRWGEIEVSGNHPALVSEKLFDTVQSVLAKRYRNPGVKGTIAPGCRGMRIMPRADDCRTS